MSWSGRPAYKGRVMAQRQAEADEFYAELTPAGATADEAMVMRQAFAVSTLDTLPGSQFPLGATVTGGRELWARPSEARCRSRSGWR
jgi:hypothetical protein